MAKYSYEEKIAAIELVTKDELSTYEAAKITGIPRSCILRWVDHYNEHGIEGISKKNKNYDGDFKISVIEYMHANHLSLSKTAVKFGIPSDSTVGKWERIYYEEGLQALYRDNRGRKKKMSSNKSRKKLNKEVEEDLIAEVQRLRMENEYLKKLQALVQERIARENGKEPPSSKN